MGSFESWKCLPRNHASLINVSWCALHMLRKQGNGIKRCGCLNLSSYATWVRPSFLYFESTSLTIRRTNVFSRCERLLSRTITLHKRAALSLLLCGTNLLAFFLFLGHFFAIFSTQCFHFYDTHVSRSCWGGGLWGIVGRWQEQEGRHGGVKMV